MLGRNIRNKFRTSRKGLQTVLYNTHKETKEIVRQEGTIRIKRLARQNRKHNKTARKGFYTIA